MSLPLRQWFASALVTVLRALYFHARLLAFALFILCLFDTAAISQAYIQEGGLPSYGTSETVPMGSINISNGSIHLEFMLYNAGQRHSIPSAYKLIYDSKIWTNVDPVNGLSVPWTPLNNGWRFVQPTNGINRLIHSSCDGNQIFFNYRWIAPDGTRHPFDGSAIFTGNQAVGGAACSTSAGTITVTYLQGPYDVFATDNSGYRIRFVPPTPYSNPTIYAPDGTVVDGPTILEDTNGNDVTVLSGNGGTNNLVGIVEDSLGRTPVLVNSVT